MTGQPNQKLLIAGGLLAFLGLSLGAVLPVFTNPRMALSSHQQGILGGTLMIVFGLAWPCAKLLGRRAVFTERLLVIGGYAIWIGTLLAAGFGTSRATPIAGAGFTGARWQEAVVAIVLLLGSLSTLVGVGSMLVGFTQHGGRSDHRPEALTPS